MNDPLSDRCACLTIVQRCTMAAGMMASPLIRWQRDTTYEPDELA